jgi:hypothetical protein
MEGKKDFKRVEIVEIPQVQNILLSLSTFLCKDISQLVLTYLTLLLKEINFSTPIWEIYTYENKVCVNIGKPDSQKLPIRVYCVGTQTFLKTTKYFDSTLHSNWRYDEMKTKFIRETNETLISISWKILTRQHFFIKVRDKNTFPPCEQVFEVLFYPQQVYQIQEDDLKGILISSETEAPLVFINDKKEFYELSIKVESWKSWCIWKHLLVIQNQKKIRFYDLKDILLKSNYLLYVDELDLETNAFYNIFSWMDYLYISNGKRLSIYT